jgi:hypothetical protein
VLPVGPFGAASRPTNVRSDEMNALPITFPFYFRDFGSYFRIQAAFSSHNENFWVSHQMCRKDVGRDFRILIKNKLQNPSENCEMNLMILINLSLAHVGYCST